MLRRTSLVLLPVAALALATLTATTPAVASPTTTTPPAGGTSLVAATPTATPTATPAATPTAPSATPTALVLTLADDGRTYTVPADTEVEVRLQPRRADDVWDLPALGRSNVRHDGHADRSGTTARVRVGATTVLRSRTTNPCTTTSQPCAYTPETWSLTLEVPDPRSMPDYSREQPCPGPVAAQPGTRVVTRADSGRSVVVRQGDTLLLDAGCSSDPVTVARPGAPLFADVVDAASGSRSVRVSFSTRSTGRTVLQWQTEVPCCYGRPDALFRVTVTVVAADAVVRPEDEQCVESIAAPNPVVLAGSRVPLVGQADPGATVRVSFRRAGSDGFTQRRTVVADASGTFRTDYVADAAYEFYAAAGLACRTRVDTARLKPRTTAPATVRRGSTVALQVLGEPGAPVTVAFRRRGQSTSVVRRAATLDATGRYATTYRADDDQRVVATDTRQAAIGNTVLVQVR